MPKGGSSGRAVRAMRKREPKLIEGDRKLLGIRGPATSQIGVDAMKDLVTLKKPDAKLLSRKNDIRPLEDATSIEFLAERNDCSAYVYTSHNKKRPHNLVLGRMYDGHVLDQVELGITGYAGIKSFPGDKKLLGQEPAFVFQGDAWERVPALTKLQNLVLDSFGGRNMSKLALRALDHVITLTAVEPEDGGAGAGGAAAPSAEAAWRGVIHWRVYYVNFLRSGVRVPRVELTPMGPSMDWSIRRTHFASSDLMKAALKQPDALRAKRPKNVSKDEMGFDTLGQVHMQRQDFAGLQLKKTKAVRAELKAARRAASGAGGDEEDGAGAGAGGMEEDGDEAPELEDAAPAAAAASAGAEAGAGARKLGKKARRGEA